MTITHETKWKKQDGTEVEVVPLKDIVVTAPGYFNWGADWRREESLCGAQKDQLYLARDELWPKEADYCEQLDMNSGENGGRARFRAYIEKAKLPALRKSIQQSMALRSVEDYLKSQGYEIELSDRFKDKSKIRRTLSAPASFVKQRLNQATYGGGYQETYFYCPQSKDSLEVDFNPYKPGIALVIDIEKDNVESLLWKLARQEDGLLDKIREEILREIIAQK